MNIINGFMVALPGAVAQGIIWGIMAIGVYITYKILDIADLTVDGSFATGGLTLGVCMAFNMNIWLAMLIAFAVGCAAGLVTGIFHTKFGIPAILAGILMQLALWSINLRISALSGNSSNITIKAAKGVILSSRNTTMAIVAGGLFVLVIIAVMYWFFGTERGHSLRATGCNPNMARANGINTETNKVIGLILSNGIVSLSGAMLAQYQGFADINMGRGAIVIGLAAVIIGEVIFGKIFKNFALKLLAAVFGGIIYYIVMQFVLNLGLNANDLKMLSAIVVAIFLGIPYWKKKLAETRPAKEEN